MKMPWPIVFYTDNLTPPKAGVAQYFWIRIAKKYRDDEGIYRHECFHVAQWFAGLALWVLGCYLAQAPHWVIYALGLFTHQLAYEAVTPYRLWSEVLAYRVQTRYADAKGGRLSPEGAARRLAGQTYGLGITEAQALRYF